MKRLIKASNALSQMREAQRQLAFLSKEKVDYVRKCYNDVLAEYSKVDPEHPYPSYMYDDMADFLENVGYEQEHDYSNHNIDLFVRDSSSSKERISKSSLIEFLTEIISDVTSFKYNTFQGSDS